MDIKFYKKDFSYFVIDNYFSQPELSQLWPDIKRLGKNLLSPEETSRAIDDTGVVGKNTGRFITDEPIDYFWHSKSYLEWQTQSLFTYQKIYILDI